MDDKIDFSLYEKVKARFSSVEKGKILFASLSSTDVKDLMVQVFSEEKIFEEYYYLLNEHQRENRPYAVASWENDGPTIYFKCHEFAKEETITAGKIKSFELRPFKEKRTLDLEQLKKDFALLTEFLSGDSEAS